ncbi:hypothetical protein FLM06_16300 [Vibrio cholerae]|uniref:hypothetical protein n=1 Tax=Vibrio cholerae TaxID=666 RepID=UPI001157E466|nr:hypothetical protein [Vibrio cholerae]TQO77384.1 hypothetical protein FLM06_16300 [Vibrio cholerae]TQP45177.1 hypothetical protein FLL99_12880 [Vibrio cholerae]
MSNYKVRKRNQKYLNWINGISGGMSLLVGSVIQLDLNATEADWFPYSKSLVGLIKNNAPTILIAIAFCFFVSAVLLKISRPATVVKCLEKKLDVIKEWLFCDDSNDYNDNHRVTLFKYKRTYWGLLSKKRYWCFKYFPWSLSRHPFSGWLVPIARSGYTGQKAKAVFWAPDDGLSSEGIAGVAWATNSIVVRQNLPKITNLSSIDNKKKYCDSTRTRSSVLQSYVSAGRVPARSFVGFPILGKNGKPWGVAVLDSKSAEGILIEEVHKAVSVSGPVLAVLLEEL